MEQGSVVKEYLTTAAEELATLNRMVPAFLDLAELGSFAKRYGKGILLNAETFSHQAVLEKLMTRAGK